MKLTNKRLKRIIKEEIAKVLKEGPESYKHVVSVLPAEEKGFFICTIRKITHIPTPGSEVIYAKKETIKDFQKYINSNQRLEGSLHIKNRSSGTCPPGHLKIKRSEVAKHCEKGC